VLSFNSSDVPLEIAQILARTELAVWVFQFRLGFPASAETYEQCLPATWPFLWSNYTHRDLASWPSFRHRSRAPWPSGRSFSNLYGTFRSYCDPGPVWKRFGAENHDILWLADTLDPAHAHSMGARGLSIRPAASIDALEDALTAKSVLRSTRDGMTVTPQPPKAIR